MSENLPLETPLNLEQSRLQHHRPRGEGAFECHLAGCHKRFYHECSLRRHHMSVHLKLKPFSCTICQKSFFEKSGLKRHLKRNKHQQAVSMFYEDQDQSPPTRADYYPPRQERYTDDEIDFLHKVLLRDRPFIRLASEEAMQLAIIGDQGRISKCSSPETSSDNGDHETDDEIPKTPNSHHHHASKVERHVRPVQAATELSEFSNPPALLPVNPLYTLQQQHLPYSVDPSSLCFQSVPGSMQIQNMSFVPMPHPGYFFQLGGAGSGPYFVH